MKIATIQMPMAYTVADNVATILVSLDKAKTLGAEVAVFPECAVIGYHRDMGTELSPDLIDASLAQIRQKCAALNIAAVVGTPYYGAGTDNKPWNAVAIYSHLGELVVVLPKFLFSRTEKHLDIFTVGEPSSRQCFQLLGRTCALLICCELCGEVGAPHESFRDIMPTLDEAPEIVFVPGVFDMNEHGDPVDTITARSARSLAREFQTSVVVANWPEWGGPAAKGFMGGSLAVDVQGETLCQAPPNEPSITVVTV